MGQNNQKYRLQYWATRSSVRLFTRSLALLSHSLAPPYLLRLLRSLVRSLTHFAHSLARGTVNYSMANYSVFFFYSDPQCIAESHKKRFRYIFMPILSISRSCPVFHATLYSLLPLQALFARNGIFIQFLRR